MGGVNPNRTKESTEHQSALSLASSFSNMGGSVNLSHPVVTFGNIYLLHHVGRFLPDRPTLSYLDGPNLDWYPFTMLALSSSWISKNINDGIALINALQRFNVCAVELEYRISKAMFLQLLKLLPKTNLNVVSVHNYFPIPPIFEYAKGSGDLFRLSSPDQEERQCAIGWTTKTIECAADLGARAVVLHCGYVEMDMELDILYAFYKTNRINSKEAQAFISKKLEERERFKPIYLESLLHSLEQLAPIAAKHGVMLGIENRYHYCGDYHDRSRSPNMDVDVCFSGQIAVSFVPLRAV